MRVLVTLAVLAVLGMVGMVVQHQCTKVRSHVGSGAAGPKIETISEGERVEVEKHLVDGQWTVFEFGADW